MNVLINQNPSVRQLHNLAMDFAERAMLAEKEKNYTLYSELNLQAYKLERQAAEAALVIGKEPTRSILLRSAATLALECKLAREAERLISIALSGEPPNEIAEELRDLLERVNFERHLSLRGISLQPGELQISMTGEEVSFGMMASDLAIERLQDAEALLIRTAERKTGLPYRKGGRPAEKVKEMFSVYMSVPRAASFALTLRLGGSQALFKQQDDVIAEMIECMGLVNDNNMDALHSRIEDKAYYDNFLGLTQKIAPDGKKIKMVGFTAQSSSGERTAMLTTPRKDIIRIDGGNKVVTAGRGANVEISGLLGFANRFRRDNIIKIQPSTGSLRTVFVPEGLMDDVVRPYWDREVRITGQEDRNTGIITLTTISPI